MFAGNPTDVDGQITRSGRIGFCIKIEDKHKSQADLYIKSKKNQKDRCSSGKRGLLYEFVIKARGLVSSGIHSDLCLCQ